jgi:hypothetical protein
MPVLLHLGYFGWDEAMLAALTVIAVAITAILTWNRPK